MEKLIHLLWRSDDHDEVSHREHMVGEIAPMLAANVARVNHLDVLTGDTSVEIPTPPVQLGLGPQLASVVTIWLDSIDDRGPIIPALQSAPGTTGRVDQYLVTESVPQPSTMERDWPLGTRTPGATLFSRFPKPDRLTDEEFFHGWHDIHTPSTPLLHPLRVEYVRNSVARVLTPGSPPIRALVAERWAAIDDYSDPTRLFSSDDAIEASMAELPLYADFESLNSRPMFQWLIR